VPGKEPQPLTLEGKDSVTIPAVHVYGVLTLGLRGAQQQMDDRLETAALLARAKMAVATKPSTDPLVTTVAVAQDNTRTPQEAQKVLEGVALQSDQDYLKGLQAAVTTDKPTTAFAFGAPADFPGWKAVKADTAYAAEPGFGWLPATNDTDPIPDETYYLGAVQYGKGYIGPEPHAGRLPFWPYKQPVPQPLQWSLSAGTPRTFRVDVPQGNYRVRLVNVNPSWTNLNFRVAGMVTCNGRVMLPDVVLEKSDLAARSFETAAQDGHLDLTLGGATGWGVAAVIVEPVTAMPYGAMPAGVNLRDWQVSPRYANPEWWRNVTTPLEARLDSLPLTGWTKLQANCEKSAVPWAGLPVIDLGTNREAEIGDVVYAATTIKGGSKLCFGSTSAATLWLNGKFLGYVPNEKGLREEFVAPLTLKPGENKLVVKLQRYWERRWLFMATVK